MDVMEVQQRLGVLLSPFSYIYKALMAIRRVIWQIGILHRLDPHCPCISVGNISWGGTGKTPVIDWLLHWAERKQIQSVVLTRGYKADTNTLPLYVKSHHTAKDVGDEPLMLALEHPNVAVLVDPNRVRSGKYAIQVLKPELMLLDDSFQYLRIKRSLDLVLLREDDFKEQWNKVIPAGSWREGAQALEDASAFLIKADQATMSSLLPVIQNKLFHFKKPVFSFYLKPIYLKSFNSQERITAKEFTGRPYILVTGVGNPKQVVQTVETYLGHSPEAHLIFSDHHRYTFYDVNRLLSFKLPIICTMKDFVKLQWLPVSELWGLEVKTIFEGSLWSKESFPQWIETWWEREQKSILQSLGEKSVDKWQTFDSSNALFFDEQDFDELYTLPLDEDKEFDNSDSLFFDADDDDGIEPVEGPSYTIDDATPIPDDVLQYEVIEDIQQHEIENEMRSNSFPEAINTKQKKPSSLMQDKVAFENAMEAEDEEEEDDYNDRDNAS